MKFETRQYTGAAAGPRNWGVATVVTDRNSNTELSMSVDLSAWHPLDTEPMFVYLTEREAMALCALMNDLFSSKSVEEVSGEI